MENFFKPAGDLDDFNLKNNNINNNNNMMNDYFVSMNDFDNISNDNNDNDVSIDGINNYLSKIVSGQEYPYQCELGTLCGMCSMFVNFDRLISMVDSGNFNIIKAECYSPDMIEIQFQEYRKQSNKHF